MIKKFKRKWNFWKMLIIEVLETLCTICMYLEYDGRHCNNPYYRHMASHFHGLKYYSERLKKGVYGDE